MAWFHRLSGIFLVCCLWSWIYRFLFPSSASAHVSTIKLIFIALIQWFLLIPVIFHALNGGRLVLYEVFGKRNDEVMIRWVFGLSILYLALMVLTLSIGTQGVSPFLFWLISLTAALVAGYGIAAHIWNSKHSFFWKLQRISGGFLLVMVPAYLLFTHLKTVSGIEENGIIIWMQYCFVKAVHLVLFAAALYHGGYGIWSVVSDYLSSSTLRIYAAFLVTIVTVISAWICIKLV